MKKRGLTVDVGDMVTIRADEAARLPRRGIIVELQESVVRVRDEKGAQYWVLPSEIIGVMGVIDRLGELVE